MNKLYALCIALGLMMPAAAWADEFDPELRLTIAGASHANTDASFDIASSGTRTGMLEAGVAALVAPGLTFGAEYTTFGEENDILGGYSTDLRSRGLNLRVRYALDVIPIVRPYVTGAAGFVVVNNSFSLFTKTFEDRAAAFAGDLAGGIEIQTPGRVSVGFYNDYGYAFRTPIDFDDARTEDDEFDGSVDLGAVRLGGFQWRLGTFIAVRL